ncbi:MAG: hypothetical protein AAF790_09695 [Planctomycetota bacterium]
MKRNARPIARRHRRRRRRGAVLLTVLIVIALMTIGSAAYFEWTFTERRATDMFGRQTQARYAAESAVEYLRVFLAQDQTEIENDGGLYNNPAAFRGLTVLDDSAAALRCRATVLAPNIDYGEYDGVRFGLENESSRLNLNTLLSLDQVSDTAAREQLMGLPGMTEAIADAILDWIDPDTQPREFGAELTHYAALAPAYEPQNGPLESIDQLLMVRDVTPALLYGLDTNRDLLVTPADNGGVAVEGEDNNDGQMNRGWSAYLTTYSAEREVDPEGEPKINVNMEDLEELHAQIEQKLGREEANFIVAFRQSGPRDAGEVGGQTVRAQAVQIDFNSPAAVTIDNLLRLVGVQVDVVQAGENDRQTIEAIFPADPMQTSSYLPRLLDYLTVYSDPVAPGRLNINQAPRSLLESVPGMPPEAVESIIGNRDFEVGADRPDRRHATWIMTEGYVTLEEMRTMMPFVTSGGDVYRAHVVGFFDEEGPRRRIEAVIDATQEAPLVLHQQDLSALGGGPAAADLGAGPPAQDAAGTPPAAGS